MSTPARRRPPLARVLPAVLPVVLLAVAACGADDGGDPADGSTGTAAAGTTTGPMTPEPMTSEGITSEPVTSEPVTSQPVASEGDAAGPTGVPPALDFTATTLDGATFEGASLAGAPTLLWFWAPWCTVCAREAPEVAELAAEYEGRANVVGVAGLSRDAEAMAAFVERGGLEDVVSLADLDGTLYTRFGVASQYDSVILDAEGVPMLVSGPVPVDGLRAELDALLG
ncbi:redoxin domain-containing protein [Aquipuribacter sp. SD81]|uniref:redoxin domain-containing protein n=1 Tax=Aquipuribacter sp. SD81 TaxID=3127703 RepID=UPI003017DDC0